MKPWTLASGLVLGAGLAIGGAGIASAQQAQQDPGATQEQMQPGDAMTQEGTAAGTEQPMQSGSGMAGAAPMGMDGDAVRQLQQALNEAGHDIAVDGMWGPETQSAVRQFQQQLGLQATGEPDQQTLAALGVDATQMQPAAGPEGEMREQSDMMQERGEGSEAGAQQEAADPQQGQGGQQSQ